MAITHFFCSWHSSRSFSVIYIYTHYLPICRQRTSPCGYIYIYTYTHIHIHIYIYTYWHIDMYTYTYIYMYMWHSGFEWRLTPIKLVDVRLNFGHPFFHGPNWIKLVDPFYHWAIIIFPYNVHICPMNDYHMNMIWMENYGTLEIHTDIIIPHVIHVSIYVRISRYEFPMKLPQSWHMSLREAEQKYQRFPCCASSDQWPRKWSAEGQAW